jgi:hypothetical protein
MDEREYHGYWPDAGGLLTSGTRVLVAAGGPLRVTVELEELVGWPTPAMRRVVGTDGTDAGWVGCAQDGSLIPLDRMQAWRDEREATMTSKAQEARYRIVSRVNALVAAHGAPSRFCLAADADVCAADSRIVANWGPIRLPGGCTLRVERDDVFPFAWLAVVVRRAPAGRSAALFGLPALHFVDRRGR